KSLPAATMTDDEVKVELRKMKQELIAKNNAYISEILPRCIIEACDVCLKDDDKDVESVMNSIVSLLLILETEKQEALIESLCKKMQLLSNLFHGMDENTPVRCTVFCSLIKVTATCNAIFSTCDLQQV
uniref:Uncharacterized protein n=1 Tax=Acanthochromis polyacanthus TaxID=80966 RepID=A0A3Q1GDB5_9TELE